MLELAGAECERKSKRREVESLFSKQLCQMTSWTSTANRREAKLRRNYEKLRDQQMLAID